MTDLRLDPLNTPPTGDDEESPPEGSRLPWFAFVILALLAIGGTVDLILDRPTRFFSLHVLFELGLIF